MRCITFMKQFIDPIKAGEKTVTRRINCNFRPGDLIYFKMGRTGKKEGYLRIKFVDKERMNDIFNYDISEFWKEGINHIPGSGNIITRFLNLWDRLNPKMNHYLNPELYRIEFEYLKDNQWH